MLINANFRQNFYEEIRKETFLMLNQFHALIKIKNMLFLLRGNAKKHTLIIVNADVDALCASVILTYALSCDDATFSLSPVDSWRGIEKAIAENHDQLRNIVLINCGASRPLTELSANVKIFVLDSHRPVHLENIYNSETNPVNVLVNAAEVEEWDVPEASQIFENDEDESDEDQNNEEGDFDDDENEGVEDVLGGSGDVANESMDGENVRRQRRPARKREDIASMVERRALKKQQSANWRRNRATVLWNYYMNSWHSTSSAVFMLELVHDLGKSNSAMMWCASVGLTSQFTDHLISVDAYTTVCIDRMRAFIRKFAPRKPIEQTRGDGVLRITFDKELILPLYSHWSVYKSIYCDSMFVCQSKLWSQKGEHNLKHILASLGLTLAECRQNFEAMNSDRRAEVFAILEKYMDANFATFNAYFAYASRFNAADFSRILALRLESRVRGGIARSLYDRFAETKSILNHFLEYGGRVTKQMNNMVERYKVAIHEIMSLVFLSTNQGHIISTARYFMLDLQQSSSLCYLSSRHCINLFAHSLLRAFASTKSARRTSKPFIISIPLGTSDEGDENIEPHNRDGSHVVSKSPWYLVVGIMPLAEILSDSQRKSVIGRAFEHVANEAKIEVQLENFDSNFIRIRADDRAKFFNSLEARLEIA